MVAEIGPISAFANWADADPEESWEDGHHDNWDGDSYNEWTGAGYVAAAHDEEDDVEDEDLATALLAMAECDNDETPAEGQDELGKCSSTALWITWPLAPTRARTRAKESLLGKARTKTRQTCLQNPTLS